MVAKQKQDSKAVTAVEALKERVGSASSRRLCTIRQTAVELNCSPRSVWRLLSLGELTKVSIGRAVRIPSASIEALIARGGSR